MCSSTLHATDVSDTGLQFEAMCLSRFLKRGTISASLQSDSTLPVSIEHWYMRLRIDESSSAADLRMNVGIPSGSAVLYTFRSFRCFFTPFGLILISCIG